MRIFRQFVNSKRLGLFYLLPIFVVLPAVFSVSITSLVTSEPEPAFEARHHALHGLELSDLEAGGPEFLVFLRQVSIPEGWEADDFYSLKNDIADRLIIARIHSDALARIALNDLADPAAHPVWRDYCLQKLPDLIGTGGLAEKTSQSAIRALHHYAAGAEAGLTGTALIASLRLQLSPKPTADSFDSFSDVALSGLALRCAADTAAPLIDRVTALQVAAELGHPGAAALARSLLAPASPSEAPAPAMLRVSALAALGQVGDTADHEIIVRYRKSPDVRLRAAARTALKHLSAEDL